MAIKRKLTEAEVQALPADFQKEYKAVGDGTFVLDVEGEDFEHVSNKRRIEAEHREKAEKKARDLQDQLDDVRRGNIPKADVEALEKSWREKQADADKKYQTREAELTQALSKTVLDSLAGGIASELFTVPDVMTSNIRSRLEVEIVDGNPLVRILKDGKRSAMSAEDLKNELKGDAKLAPILIGSSAAGSGASGGNGNSGGGTTSVTEFNKLNDKQRTEMYEKNRPEFDRLSKMVNEAPQPS